MHEMLEKYFDKLWPICRSITGDGLRESLKIISEIVPLELTEVPSGKEVFDWTVPNEWNIRDAFIVTPAGEKIACFKNNNLLVVNYSIPVNKEVPYDELMQHLHSVPEMPDAIPYITSYYKENWGFCLDHRTLLSLPKEGNYHVFIDSDLKPGSLTYGQFYLPGKSDKEILFSTYCCHPSMANNELSGPLVTAFLAAEIAKKKDRHYSYRFLFAPETIGVIVFLDEWGETMKKNLAAGYVVTCVGDDGKFHYKKSRKDNALCDRVAEHVLKFSDMPFSIEPFSVGGSDERQYCSPGFNLPVGSLMRTPYQRYPEYHTSLDNKNLISFKALNDSLSMYVRMVELLEYNQTFNSLVKGCEPQLGKRGMYPSSVNPVFDRTNVHRMMHLLSYCDGNYTLIDIAERRSEYALLYKDIIDRCLSEGLIEIL
jgi:aminopeptidase-like protein